MGFGSADICARPWEYSDYTSVHFVSPPRVLLCVSLILLREPGQMVSSGDGGNEEGGEPHVVILYSDRLCNVDKPPALNKPVAAPGGGAFDTDNGRRRGWMEKVVKQEDATGAVALVYLSLFLGSITCSSNMHRVSLHQIICP